MISKETGPCKQSKSRHYTAKNFHTVKFCQIVVLYKKIILKLDFFFQNDKITFQTGPYIVKETF